MSRILRISMLALTIVLASGWASSIAYRADYVPDKPVAAEERIAGKVLVYTTKSDDERLVTAGATSFTGSGAKLTTPIGMMARKMP